jgi:hypothetical protein
MRISSLLIFLVSGNSHQSHILVSIIWLNVCLESTEAARRRKNRRKRRNLRRRIMLLQQLNNTQVPKILNEKPLQLTNQSFIEKHKKKLIAAAAAIGISTIAYASLDDIQKFFSKGQEKPITSGPDSKSEEPKTKSVNFQNSRSWSDEAFIQIARTIFIKLGILDRLKSVKTILSMGQLYLFFQLIQSICPKMMCNPLIALAFGSMSPKATSEFVRNFLGFGILVRGGLEYANKITRKVCHDGVCWIAKKLPENIRNALGYSGMLNLFKLFR